MGGLKSSCTTRYGGPLQLLPLLLPADLVRASPLPAVLHPPSPQALREAVARLESELGSSKLALAAKEEELAVVMAGVSGKE